MAERSKLKSKSSSNSPDFHNSRQKLFFRMAAAMCQTLPSFYSECNTKSMFIFVSNEFHEKYKETQDFCVSIHNSYCFLEGKCHSILIETSPNHISMRLDKYQSFYQQDIDYLYTLYKHRFYISIVALSEEVFNQLSRVVQHDLN